MLCCLFWTRFLFILSYLKFQTCDIKIPLHFPSGFRKWYIKSIFEFLKFTKKHYFVKDSPEHRITQSDWSTNTQIQEEAKKAGISKGSKYVYFQTSICSSGRCFS